MPIIYQPTGKAREYCDLAANLYTGCAHGCSYCYAPACLRQTAEKFTSNPQPRKDILRQLTKESPAYAGQEVHLCFTCDPYQPIEQAHRLTRQTLDIFTQHGVRARILTKGGRRCLDDSLHFKGNGAIVGATLTFINAADSAKWEPGAASPLDRIATLASLYESGVETWASLEPVIDPEQSLELIRRTHTFVDTFKVGKWNYAAGAKEIDWADFARKAVDLLEKHDKKYYIKDDLRKFL